MRLPLITVLLSLSFSLCLVGQDPLPSIEEKTDGMKRHEGFFTFWWDAREGKIWLRLAADSPEFIYVESLVSGLGSNPVGLDRSQLGEERVVRFRRLGPKALLVQRNLRFRATTDNPDERRAVEESFAPSVLWGFEVAAATGNDVLVDLSGFLIRDAHGVIGRLKSREEGTFKLDASRSGIDPGGARAFPRNVELEAWLTYTSAQPGRRVRETAAEGGSFTLRQRHSFVKLPEPGYRMRRFDPRAPSFAMSFSDYGAPLDAPLEQRYITRHRLEKKDPAAARSEAVEPIVYYVDRGAPEPVRSALVEGARWWNRAFEAAGFIDAFKVEVLPEGADPLDVRYNVIQWVHRSTRGWSYGSSVVDPRTGEILKGHVLLGSLRARQDRMIFEALVPQFRGLACPCGMGGTPGLEGLARLDPQADPVRLALARLRQLSAHEVGHTLGFAHNFAASTNDRASVMDYPAPLVKRRPDGTLDLGAAYGVGIGAWDVFSVRYAYTPFAEDQEAAGLKAIVTESLEAGLRFASDQDARSLGTAHAHAHLWDNGGDPVEELERLLEVRRAALARFGVEHVPEGTPVAALEETLVPLYYLHRYQVEAVAKLIGGFDYTYAVRGDGQVPMKRVPADQQARALEVLMSTLSPEALAVPERILQSLPPAPFGGRGRAERFPRRAGAIFDPLGAAASAADLTIAALLHPDRCARLHMGGGAPHLPGVLDRLVKTVFEGPTLRDVGAQRIQEEVRWVLLERLKELASSDRATPAVRAWVTRRLKVLEGSTGATDLMGRDIQRFLERPYEAPGKPGAPLAPPGSPIGR